MKLWVKKRAVTVEEAVMTSTVGNAHIVLEKAPLMYGSKFYCTYYCRGFQAGKLGLNSSIMPIKIINLLLKS